MTTNPLADRPKNKGKVTIALLEESAAKYNKMHHTHENGIEYYVGENEFGEVGLMTRRIAPSVRPVAHLKPLKRQHDDAEIIAWAKKVEAVRNRAKPAPTQGR